MLTRALYLSAIWFVASLLLTLLFGTRLRRTHFVISFVYSALLVSFGDVLALLTFGRIGEVFTASILALLGAFWLRHKLPDWNVTGQTLLLFSITTTVLYLVYALAITAFSPLSPIALIFSFIVFVFQVVALLLWLTYAFEAIDVMCRVRWHHVPLPMSLDEQAPFVSLHVPTYSEPPELVEKTLRALARLDYPHYEVILIDNNTPEETQWQPLVTVCHELGFKCVHLDHWPGYKSGALNFALALTDPRTELIGVVDADYIVEPDYLRQTVPYFANPQLAFLQAPQDYRDFEGNRFLEAAYNAYKYFFDVSLPSRNERNAIIFGGTMGLIRKTVLQEIGGWDEWCITEDAEASLRILKRGYTGLYINHTFGRGLMPLNFEGLKKQRFRWAFGGVQILKKHWSALMPWARYLDSQNQLTISQRYFYLIGGLQWFNEWLTFLFSLILILGVLLTFSGSVSRTGPLIDALLVIPIIFLGTGLLRVLWVLRSRLDLSWRHALDALTIWFSLSWVVTLACWEGLVQARGVFLRTPKTSDQSAWARALQITIWETILGAICVIAGVTLLLTRLSWFTVAVFFFCLFQGAVYLSAPWHSLLSLQSDAGRRAVLTGELRGQMIYENRLARMAAIMATVLLVVAVGTALEPQPVLSPGYVALRPSELVPAQVFKPLSIPPIIPHVTVTPTPVPTSTPTPEPTNNLKTTIVPVATQTPRPGPILATSIPIATHTPSVPTTVPTQPSHPSPTSIPPPPTPQPVPTNVPPHPTSQPGPTNKPPAPTAKPPPPPAPTSEPPHPTPRR